MSVLSVAAIAVSSAIIAIPSSAATGTWTKISSPKGPGQQILQFADASSSPPHVTVSGSTSLDLVPGTDTINVFCFFHSDTQTTSSSPLNAAPLAIDSSHNFTGVIASSQPTCVLRAIPSTYAGLSGSNNSGYVGAFSGPTFYYGGFVNTKTGSVLGRQITYGYVSNGAVQFASPANGAIQVTFVDDPFSQSLGPALDVNNLVLGPDNLVPSSGTPSRSEILIDGHNVYTPATLVSIAASPASVPSITVSRTHSSVTGYFSVTETDPLRWCTGNAFPQSSGSCNMVQTGVTLVTSYAMTSGGLVASVRQRFISTDHASHSLKVEYANTLVGQSSGQPGIMLPGQSSFFVPSPNTTQNNLPTGAHTIFTTSDIHATDGYPDRSDGGLTYSGKPQLYFASTNTYALRYTRTVPKNGAAAFAFAMESGFRVSSVKSLAAAQQTALTPHLALTAPALRTSDHTPTIKGKVTNATNGFPAKVTIAIGTKSKTVNVSSTGTFAVTWTFLKLGKHTAKAKATDPSGLVLLASRTFKIT